VKAKQVARETGGRIRQPGFLMNSVSICLPFRKDKTIDMLLELSNLHSIHQRSVLQRHLPKSFGNEHSFLSESEFMPEGCLPVHRQKPRTWRRL